MNRAADGACVASFRPRNGARPSLVGGARQTVSADAEKADDVHEAAHDAGGPGQKPMIVVGCPRHAGRHVRQRHLGGSAASDQNRTRRRRHRAQGRELPEV